MKTSTAASMAFEKFFMYSHPFDELGVIIKSAQLVDHVLCSKPTMSLGHEEYLAVLKASYDYNPQSEDEIAIKEDQILFLKERVDDEYVPTFRILASTYLCMLQLVEG